MRIGGYRRGLVWWVVAEEGGPGREGDEEVTKGWLLLWCVFDFCF